MKARQTNQFKGYKKLLSCYFIECLESSINEQIIGKKI